jgi:SEC-C motif-containing protein
VRAPDSACPCGSGRSLAACCDPLLAGAARAATAEQLMRSRYTAYALGDEAYLLRTWHASTRPSSLNLAAAPVKWLGLRIVRTEAGGPDDRDGIVEFEARYKPPGRAERLREVSRFVNENGAWYYVDGTVNAE